MSRSRKLVFERLAGLIRCYVTISAGFLSKNANFRGYRKCSFFLGNRYLDNNDNFTFEIVFNLSKDMLTYHHNSKS